jgi:dihydroorotase
MSAFVLRGGRVVDPAQGIDGPFDVVVADGKIRELLPPGGASQARSEDVAGAVVTPGLIDLHGHWWEGSPYGIDPWINARSGVTTTCDAGSSGYENFRAFRTLTIDRSRVRVLAFLHIGSLGLPSVLVGELEDFRYVRVLDTIDVIRNNPDVIVGVKARLGVDPAGENIMAALESALEAAAGGGVPLMVHVSTGADLRLIAPRLRAGDIMTHAFTGGGDGKGLLFDRAGRVLPELREAKQRGVVLDVGHGCGSFAWPVYRRAIGEGFGADTISTDLHRLSIEGPVFDMLTTMSKFLHAGLSIPEIVAASTTKPAGAIRREDSLGSLEPGRRADVAVFRIEDGTFDYVDSFGQTERANSRFAPVLTVNGGEVVRPADVSIELRRYNPADNEVDCGAPLVGATA